MKTKELIRRLEECDPSGELECSVKGIDIYSVTVQPGYHDGPYEVLIRDLSKTNYNITGAKMLSGGQKVILEPLSINDALMEDSALCVEYDNHTLTTHQKFVEAWRQKARTLRERE
jgi:hypothetical protein